MASGAMERKKLMVYLGGRGQRQSSKMKGKKGIIDFIIIESDFMNREKPSNYIDICVHYDKMSMLIPLPAIVSVEKIT